MNGNCEECAHWRSGIDEMGECRRHAPVHAVVVESKVAPHIWPRTHASDWCGDFKTDG